MVDEMLTKLMGSGLRVWGSGFTCSSLSTVFKVLRKLTPNKLFHPIANQIGVEDLRARVEDLGLGFADLLWV